MTISFARHQFPTAIIRHAVWLYVRFTLSYRDVEDLLAERGLDVSYETVRRWVLKFGPLFARELRRRRPRPTSQWHLDEMALMIAGRQFWLWRAVDDEGEVLDLLVQRQVSSGLSGIRGSEPACMTRLVSEHDQPHIRSPFATAAPTSRLRRAGLRKTRTFLEDGVSGHGLLRFVHLDPSGLIMS